ncbi:MAG: energy transducer TonB [Acidobacteria bacterium]|nr:MAG: energy transducer TonB [Acidobacteriota bacterium]REK02508.1 MAG: energy transducer TonB [Acidobacteriota bacterium]REK13690.1 MAG: energy transducer TonB [Acidobacteriota bacterium]REK41684.1 MAG: energy transducer TonB [Acidobacteriota bacterium]
MRVVLAILAILVVQLGLSYPAASQTEYDDGPGSGPVIWKEVSYNGFMASLPGASLKVYSSRTNEEEYKYKKYTASTENASFFVSAYNSVDHSPLKTVLDFAATKDVVDSEVIVDGVPGRRLVFSEEGGFGHEVLIFIEQPRTWIFHAVRHTDDSDDVSKFVESVRLEITRAPTEPDIRGVLKRSVSDVLAEAKKFRQLPVVGIEPDDPSSLPAREGKPGQGGMGSGSGSGSGQKALDTSEKKAGSGDSGLKILTKPRPGYSELARRYNLQGSVLLRVTFLSNGYVGKVEVVEGTPMGITGKAIDAAKRIRFNPPTRNGVPYTVNKMVQYHFTIY